MEIRKKMTDRTCVYVDPHTIERFWSYVKKASKCWLWMGGCSGKGYGYFRAGEKLLSAHRFSWMIEHGEIPEGLKILHHCDNPPCVNPACLFLGTTKDNDIDMRSKGRQPDLRGERNGNARFTEREVLRIRELAFNGLDTAEVAEYLDLNWMTVYKIITRRRWSHI